MPPHDPEQLPLDEMSSDTRRRDTAVGLLELTEEFLRQASPQVRAEVALFLTSRHGWHPETGLHAYLDTLSFAAYRVRHAEQP